MENSQNKCTSTVKNLKEKCTTLLNPQFLADNLKVMLGTDQVERQRIKIDEVYALQVDGSVITVPAAFAATATETAPSTPIASSATPRSRKTIVVKGR